MKMYDVIIVGAGPGGIFLLMSWLLTIQILGLPFLKKVTFLTRENALLTVTRLRNVLTAKVVQL